MAKNWIKKQLNSVSKRVALPVGGLTTLILSYLGGVRDTGMGEGEVEAMDALFRGLADGTVTVPAFLAGAGVWFILYKYGRDDRKS